MNRDEKKRQNCQFPVYYQRVYGQNANVWHNRSKLLGIKIDSFAVIYDIDLHNFQESQKLYTQYLEKNYKFSGAFATLYHFMLRIP